MGLAQFPAARSARGRSPPLVRSETTGELPTPVDYADLYPRTTVRAWNSSLLTASSGVNSYVDRCAKAGICIAGRGPANTAASYINAYARIRSQNPDCKIGHYVINTEVFAYPEIANTASQAAMLASGAAVGDVTKRTDTGTFWRCTASPSTSLANWTNAGATYPVRPEGTTYWEFEGQSKQEKIVGMPAWQLRRAASAGGMWTSEYAGNNDLNHGSDDDAVDGSGRTLAEWQAEYYYKPGEGLHVESTLGDYIDLIWLDNCKVYALSQADLNNTGSDVAYGQGATRMAWAKRGHAAFITALRALRPDALIHGNSQFNDPGSLTTDFYSDATLGAIDGGMYEFAGQFAATDSGINSQTLHGAGWLAMYQRYKLLCDVLTGPHKQVALTIRGVVTTNFSTLALYYKAARIGICTALLGDGQCNVENSSQTIPPDFDEYAQELGAPLDAAPVAAVSGNLWARRYQNGVVVVNGATVTDPGPLNWKAGSAQTYYPTAGVYKKFSGAQQPAINDGATIGAGGISIDGWDGRILLCVTPGVHS